MFTKYASLENVQILELKGSKGKVRHASLGKLADFDNYRTSDGYLYARVRAISSRVNKNYDGWPSIELAGGQDVFDRHTSSADGFTITADGSRDYGFSTFLGKPIFVDHHNSDPSRARGVIVDAQFHVDDHKTSSRDPYYSSKEVDPEHLPGSWVELLLEVDAKAFPKFAKAIVEGSRNPHKGIDGWSMGCDVEKSVCSICKVAATCPEEYCKHIKLKGAYFDFTDSRTKQKTSKLAYENCYGVKFFELSGVFDPADETALSLEQARTAAKKEPQKEPKKDLADLQADEFIDETEEGIRRRKKQDKEAAGLPIVPNDQPSVDPPISEAYASGHVACPDCEGRGVDKLGQTCAMCGGKGAMTAPTTNGETQYDFVPGDASSFVETPGALGPRRFGSVRTADNPLPQSEMYHAPEKVDTLREEQICPVCGSSMDEDTCDVCGYQEPPDGFGNPDLTKAQDVDVPENAGEQQGEGPESKPEPTQLESPGLQPTNTPNNPAALAHVTSDMSWNVHAEEKTSARINKIERPIVATDKPATNEPKETVVSDQLQPVTSKVRTAEDFIAAVATKENNTNMDNHKVADSAPPSNEPRNKGHHPMDDARSPEKVVDVVGVGGVMDATNEQASKANGQTDVTGIGSTGVDGVSADEADGGAVGVKVDQGDEHSKNIEAIHTDTWQNGQGDSLGQQEPVTSELPEWITDSRWSHWRVEGHEEGSLEEQEQQGNQPASGGSAVKGTQPADPVGKAEDRVDVLQSVTTPANNSGPTTTWTGTEGNGVTKQQDPVTNESIALSESGLAGKPNWSTASHVFAAFRLADTEIELGLLPAEKKYERVAELERETPTVLEASFKYAQRIKRAATRKAAGVQKLPVMGRPTPTEKEASTATVATEDDSFMFGGL